MQVERLQKVFWEEEKSEQVGVQATQAAKEVILLQYSHQPAGKCF